MMMQELEKELVCSLCKDVYREPKTLGCLHSFCLECLQVYVEKNHSNSCLSCPICRTPFQSNSNSNSSSNAQSSSDSNSNLRYGELLMNLSTDSFLLNNLNIYNSLKNSIPQQQKQEQQEQKSQRPQRRKKKQKIVCIDGENEAISYCLDCRDYFCEICSRSHKTIKAIKHHQLISIDKMKDEDQIQINSITNSNPQIYCQTHQQKELELFCDDCKLPICPLCVEEHPSHKILVLSNIIEIEKQSLIDLINQVKPKEKELREGIKKCEEVIKQLEINSTTTQTQINQLFNKIRTKLDEKEKELLIKLDENEKQKKEELELQIEELKFGIENIIGSCQMIEQSLSLSNNDTNKNTGRLLSMKKLYQSRLDYLSNNNWKIEPECNSLIEFLISEKEEESIYSNISNIGILGLNEISIEKCLFSRNENIPIFKDNEFKFEITSFSKEGKEMKKGGNVKKLKIQIEGELNTENTEWIIKDLNNGKYEVKMKVKNEGKYLISLQCNRLGINSSSLQVQVFSKLTPRDYHKINFKGPKLMFGYLGSDGMTIHSNGHIYASSGDRIEIYDFEGDFLSTLGSYGNGNSQFGHPWGIATNSKGNIIVGDKGNHRIQIFDSEGNFISKFGSKGNRNGQFGDPKGICVDLNDNIYVCDCNNNRIQIFDSKGKFISTFGSKGKENNQFDDPVGITVNSHGNIIVCEQSNNRIQIFDSNGKFISTFGSKGNENGQFNNPSAICVDQNDNILVSDYFNHRIQIFDPEGKYMTKFYALKPRCMTIDVKTRRIIVNGDNNKIIIY